MEEGDARSARFRTNSKNPVTVTILLLVGSVLIGFILFTLRFTPSHHSHEILRKRRQLETDAPCEQEEIKLSMKPAVLYSPDYPNEYPALVDCSWLLVAPLQEKIRILVSEITIEPSDDCANDYLLLYDGRTRNSPLIGRYCGNPDDIDLVSTGNELLVVFVSDESYQENGFKLEYSIHIKNSCNSTLFVDEDKPIGVILSPNYPNHYPDNVDCWTHLHTSNDEGQILFSFADLDLELSEKCEFDFIEIFDGDEASDSNLIDRYCQDRPSVPIMSKGSRLLIHFHTDHLLTGKGYAISYSLSQDFQPKKNKDVGKCSWNMGKLNGTIASPNYPKFYESNQECIFNLEAPFGQRLKLIFEDVDLASDPDCNYDHIKVYDGDSLDASLKGIYCNQEARGMSILSTENKLEVQFLSDDSIEAKGFKARYVVVTGMNKIDEENEKTRWNKNDCNDPTCTEEPRPVTIIARPQNASLLEGERHILSCSSNNSEDIIIWFKDLIMLTGGEQSIPGIYRLPNGTVIIKNMNWKLQGIYTCVILSSGQMETASAWVTLKKPPQDKNICDIKFDLIPAKPHLLEGDFHFMRCAAVNASVMWLRNGSPLDHINHPRIKVPLPGLLLINNVKAEDSGNFTCLAKDPIQNCTVNLEYWLFVATREVKSCGHPFFSPSVTKNRIVGGTEAVRGAIPWQAMLWEIEADSFCGGTLIDAEFVVTAAHCQELFFDNYKRKLLYKNLSIKLGKTNREQKESEEVVASVDTIIIHPEYNQKTFDNDIALIKLKRKVPFNDYIQPLCMADSNFLNSYVYERNVLGTVSGWGLLAEKGQKPRFLHEIRLPTVDHETCQRSTSKTITKNMFCAGYSQGLSRDACQGDSGGPFAVKIQTSWYLAGIVSWGEGCGQEGKYGVYTKVGNYYNWIKNTIQANKVSEY